jgi:hypothetical protein
MLSIPKLIILILVAIAGWYLYKAIKRRGLDGIFKRSHEGEAAKSGEPKALDMEKCRICGDFVPADARACAQARCPYPQV